MAKPRETCIDRSSDSLISGALFPRPGVGQIIRVVRDNSRDCSGLIGSTSGHCGNQYSDVGVQVRQGAIESRQLAVAASCELGKVGIGHLSMADDTSKLHISERHTVRPELVAFRTLDCADDIARGRCRLPGPQQESNETSLRDRAGRKCGVGCR